MWVDIFMDKFNVKNNYVNFQEITENKRLVILKFVLPNILKNHFNKMAIKIF